MESVLVDFLKWLNKKYAASTSRSRLSRVKRIAKYYDVLDEYTSDKCTSLMDDLTFTKSDLEVGGEIKTDIIIKGNYITGLTSLRQALSDFVDYLDSINYCVPSKKKSTAIFIGSFEGFKKYVGPKCKNEVNAFCKIEREKHNGICEYCGNKTTLQSAHIIDRPIIIKNILDKHYKKSSNLYEVDLNEFFVLFKNAHMPVKDHIFFLCGDCHDKLDKKKTITIADIQAKRKP